MDSVNAYLGMPVVYRGLDGRKFAGLVVLVQPSRQVVNLVCFDPDTGANYFQWNVRYSASETTAHSWCSSHEQTSKV